MAWQSGKHTLTLAIVASVAAATFASPAQAYVGPGLGAGVLAVIVGVIGSVFVAIFAVVWYPLKRLFKKRKPALQAEDPQLAQREE